MDPYFTKVKHKIGPLSKCIYEKNDYNGKIHTRLIIYKTLIKNKSGVSIAEWLIVLMFLLIVFLVIVFISAILLIIMSKMPASYLQDCRGRSCFPNIGLKCIDNKCQCKTGHYYESKCLSKKPLNEHCRNTNECMDNKGLICYNGICQCNKAFYWNGNTCKAKKSYGNLCNRGECLDSHMLECNSSGICSCNENRFVF
jgi:type IV secretory pathway VirB3-like protein